MENELNKELEQKIWGRIKEDFLTDCKSHKNPTVCVIVGQMGSGKSTMENKIISDFNKDIVTIDTDPIREYNPLDNEIYKKAGKEYIFETKEFVRSMTDKLLDTSIKNKNNILLHQVFRDKKKAMDLLLNFKKEGYSIKIVALSVNKLVSKASTLYRYNKGVLERNLGRYIPPKLHDEAYYKMLDSIKEIHNKNIGNIEVYTRNGELLYKSGINNTDLNPSNVIENYREAKWNQETFENFISYTNGIIKDSEKLNDKQDIKILKEIQIEAKKNYSKVEKKINTKNSLYEKMENAKKKIKKSPDNKTIKKTPKKK